MPKWIEILDRILRLYGVRTQAELGMALGMPVSVGMGDSMDNEVIPWPVLDRVVVEKKVSWDWLLAGKESGHVEGGGEDDQRPATGTPEEKNADSDSDADSNTAADSRAPDNETGGTETHSPRLETRELARELLQKGGAGRIDGNGDDMVAEAKAPADAPEAPTDEEVLDQLQDIRANLEKEMERLNRILGEEAGRQDL